MNRAKINRLKDLLSHREHTIVETDEIIQLAKEYFQEPDLSDWDRCNEPLYSELDSAGFAIRGDN